MKAVDIRAVAVVACFFMGQVAGAEELVWMGGGGDGLTSNAGNWSPARPPVDGDVLVFPEGGTGNVITSDLPVVDLGGMIFKRAYQVAYTPGGISARAWTFGNVGTIYDPPMYVDSRVNAQRMDVTITTGHTGSTVVLTQGIICGDAGHTVTIDGPGAVDVHGYGSTSGRGELVKKGTGTLWMRGKLSDGPPMTVDEGVLMAEWYEEGSGSHTVTVGSEGTLAGTALVGTVVCGGKIAPEGMPSRHEAPSYGMIRMKGNYSTPEGSSAVAELELFADGTNDRLYCYGTGDFQRTDLNVAFKEGFRMEMGKSVTLVEVPVGGSAVVPFRNAPEGRKMAYAGAAYEVGYTGGASGKDVTLTRVRMPMPSLVATATEQAGIGRMVMGGLKGMEVRVLSSTDLKTWSYSRSHVFPNDIARLEWLVAPRGGRVFYRAYAVEAVE